MLAKHGALVDEVDAAADGDPRVPVVGRMVAAAPPVHAVGRGEVLARGHARWVVWVVELVRVRTEELRMERGVLGIVLGHLRQRAHGGDDEQQGYAHGSTTKCERTHGIPRRMRGK